ncbi:glycosyltransferase family 2 protein [Amylibacter sp.]|nr:glycosyltransferase family 2 protein [Amylibacter sp.]
MNSFEYKKVWIVIAAYNEASVIKEVVSDLRAHGLHNIVVVDDGSIDDTGSIAIESGAHMLRHQVNRGQGAALQTGIDYTKLHQAEFIVTFDADGQHSPVDVNQMLKVLIESEADVALGSRFLGSIVNMSRKRLLILKLALFWTKIITGLSLTDVHNGFRIMSAKFTNEFEFTYDRMSHASEILNYIAKNKINYIECPVTITYTEHSMAKGQSNTDAIAIGLDLLKRRIF